MPADVRKSNRNRHGATNAKKDCRTRKRGGRGAVAVPISFLSGAVAQQRIVNEAEALSPEYLDGAWHE